MQSSIYLKFIAGRVPDHSQGLVDDTLCVMAQEATCASDVHFLRSPKPLAGHYYYLAVPSAALASESDLKTALAAALPGHPQHQGPGIYVLSADPYKVAVIFDEEQFDLVCNEAHLMDEFLADATLPVIELSERTQRWALTSVVAKRNDLVDSLSRKVVVYSLVALGFFSLAGVGLVGAEKWLSAKVEQNNTLTAQALDSALASIKVGSPLSKQLAEYDRKSAVALRAGGWVDAYLTKDGQESFRFFVPSWITEDYIKALGPGTVADKDAADEQLLVLTKGLPPGGKFLSSEDTVAKTEAELAEKAAAAANRSGAPVPPRTR